MQTKMKIKTGIDLLMTLLLLLLMAYQITGQELHEWFGAGELLLFLLHNVLNLKWYGNLFKGKYRLPRIIQTVVNFSVLITMLCLGFSGIVMSRHVFAVLPIHGPMSTARMMAAVFVEYIAMMCFWVWAACYVSKGIGRISVSKNSVHKKWRYL